MSVETAPLQTRRVPLLAASSRAGDRWNRPTLLAVIALTVLAAVLRFVDIAHQGFWFDEANTVLLVHMSPGKMLGLIPQTESTPPLYYCIAWVWARVFGFGEAGMRSLSAVVGTLVVPVAYGAGAKLHSRRAGLIAAALTAFNPLLIWYSQEARSYELLVLLAGTTLLAFAYVREAPTRRAVIAWSLASALALATHYYALLVVVPEAAWLLWIHRRNRAVITGIAFVAACGVALMQLAISQNATGRVTWITGQPLSRRLGEVFPQFVIGFATPVYGVLAPVAVVIAALGLALLVTRSDPEGRRRGLIAVTIVLAGVVLNLILIAAGFDDLITRNVLALWLPAAVALGAGLGALRARRVGIAATVVLCAIGLSGTIDVLVNRDLQRPNWRVVAAALGTRPAPLAPGVQGRAILIQHYLDLLPLSLSLPRLKAMPRHGAAVSELDVVTFTSPRAGDGFCWWGSGCNLDGSRAQASYPVRGFHEVSRTHVLQFTIIKLIASHPVALTPSAVAAAVHTTKFKKDELLLQR